MKKIKSTTAILIAIFAVLSIACSNAGSPVTLSENQSDYLSQGDLSQGDLSQSFPISVATENTNRTLLAVYDASIDPVAGTFTITPDNRSAQYHYPLTLLLPNVLQIVDFGFTPNLWADIKLVHPYPGTGVTGYDPRVIAILPARPGVSMDYPTLDVHANNRVILQPDGYTKLFDNLTGAQGNTNPFMAYMKNQPYRRWSGLEVTNETKKWQMDITGFGGPIQFQLVVDVSTNAPNPPQQIVDNVAEPYQINVSVDSELTSLGGIATVKATVLDWQGRMTIDSVLIEAPDLFPGTVDLAYISPGSNQNEYIYQGVIGNTLLASAGDHKFLIGAIDLNTGIGIYSESKLKVYAVNEGGDLIWAQNAGWVYYDRANAVTSLSDDSIVVTGAFSHRATFGMGIYQKTITSSWTMSAEEIFVARYDAMGNLLWAKWAGAEQDDDSLDIASRSDDSIVITGNCRGGAIFGKDEPNEIHVGSQNGGAFIACYNPDGTINWVKTATSSEECSGEGITVLPDNSITVTGTFEDSITFAKGAPNETTLTGFDDQDIFIAKYSSDGDFEWAKSAIGASYDYSYSVTSLSNGSSIITGNFYYTLTFAPGDLNEKVLWSNGNSDIFIACFDLLGSLVWVTQAGGPSDDLAQCIRKSTDDTFFITGSFGNSCTFGKYEPNQTILQYDNQASIYIAKYYPNGYLEWVKTSGGDFGSGITLLSDSSIVLTGKFASTALFGKGQLNELELFSEGYDDVFVARFNLDGDFEWAKRAGGAKSDEGRSVVSLSDDTTVVVGAFCWWPDPCTAIFGPGEISETILDCYGYQDIFVARFEP